MIYRLRNDCLNVRYFKVVDRDNAFRRQLQMRKIREYFYGTPKCELSPYSTIVNFHDFSVYRVGVGRSTNVWIQVLRKIFK